MAVTSQCNEYFDARELDPSRVHPPHVRCPVCDCAATLDSAPSQWGRQPYCPNHGLRIHPGTPTFVYYNGNSRKDKQKAVIRNIVNNKEYFGDYIFGNPLKAETHRICHELSEDALTWNVFSSLASQNKLDKALSFLVGRDISDVEPELYLWGLRIDFARKAPPEPFSPLLAARKVFEGDIKGFWTEPDLILLLPGELLLLAEIKFASQNDVAQNIDVAKGVKPKSKSGTLRRYNTSLLPPGSLHTDGLQGPFYAQLYRNVVFAVFMANELDVDWHVSNLVSTTQWSNITPTDGVLDPTGFMQLLLGDSKALRFSFRTWEDLWLHCVKKDSDLLPLSEYMRHKSARMIRAFELDS